MMGNIESQVAQGNDNQTGSNPNVAPSMRLLPSGLLPLERKSSSYLEEPVMTKATHRGEAEVTLDQPPSIGREGHEGDASGKLRYAVSEMQGWRSHMEDEHALNPNLASNRQQVEAERKIRLGQLSKLESLVYSLGGDIGHAIFQCGTQDHDKIMNFDRKISQTMPTAIPLERSGSTCVVVLVTPSHIICANAGDSRAILSKKDEVLPLSFDHKPSNDVELTRIENDGGFVRDGRVDGDLALSRSFGDFGYKFCNAKKNSMSVPPTKGQKEYRVTVYPDILVYVREPSNDQFMVLACDGIWDRLTNKDCSDLVRSLVYRDGETDVGLMCEEVIDTALELDSRDNMTCCIVMFPGSNMGRQSANSSSSSTVNGVMKRRLDREKTWGDKSTPAKRAQQRFEERRNKHRQVLSKNQNRVRSAASEPASRVTRSRKDSRATNKIQ